jgi:rhamnosyl/mannosyltransferase
VRILHLTRFYPPDPGGLETIVGRLAEGAAARGHEVRVVTATGSRWVRDPGKRITEPPRRGVVVIRVPTHGYMWSQPMARGYIAASRWPADVMYVHRPHPLADLAVLAGPRRPTIVVHHSDVAPRFLARTLFRPLSRLVARRAAAVVVAARAYLEHAGDLGPTGVAKARMIPFGVDDKRFAPCPGAPKPASFPKSEGPVGFFVGRLLPYKGLDVLIRAIAGTSLHLVIGGDGPMRPALEALVAQLGVGQQVRLVGNISDDDLPAYHQAADYVVLPSTQPSEMFGMPLLEGMACGKPVISTALPTGVREINERDVTGLEVPPGDYEALRAAMQRLANDPELRARLGAAGRQRVEQNFTADRMLDAHLALCAELCGKRVS